MFLVIPALPLLIVLLGYLSAQGPALPTILVLALLGWPWGARVIRAQTLTIRSRDFIAAARETGEKSWRIIAFEIIPNEISLIAASFVNTVLYAIGASVALAFVGLTDLNSWSLGTILYWAQTEQRAAARRLVVVRAAGPRGRASSAPRWCCSTPASTSSAAPGCARPRRREDRRPPDLADRPHPGARAARWPRQPGQLRPLLLPHGR